MTTKTSGTTIERPVLVMIGACLIVIACTVALLVVDQRNDREDQIRARGVSLVRLLAGLPSETLTDERAYQNMLQLVSFSQGTQDFAYAALVDASGRPIAEVTAPGVLVPQESVPADPSGWIGERVVELPGDRAAVMEYYVPVFDAGDLAGQIRLGYYEPGYTLVAEQVPIAATLALLIFMLTPLLYYLLRREIRPLAAANDAIETMLRSSSGTQQVTIGTTPSLTQFIERFNRFIEHAQARIHELESERGDLLASAKLISYKKSRVDTILQTLPDAVLVLDERGTINYANERVAGLLGVSREDVVSKPARQWCNNEEIAAFLSRYETSSATRYATDTLRVQALAENRNTRTLAINGYPLFSPKADSEIYGTLIVIRDVTEESLAQASRIEFVAHLGHELKTPLNTLSLYSEMLLDINEGSATERIQAANTIHDEVERLVALVNNLMSITRIEMGSIELDKQRVRVGDLLEDIRNSLGRNAEQKGIALDLSMPRELDAIMVDKDLLRIAINNLVSNAIKYNHSGGRVTIEVEDADDALRIHVTDTGLGVSPEDLKRIFEKFYRSESEDVRLRGGHGLGLSLARDLVTLHGGEITVESALGSGSTFTISLPKRHGLMRKAI